MVQAEQRRQRARKQPAEVRRDTLVDAALRVFARTPYRSAGTAEIAREAGVAEPTIYRHFSSKRELYLAALARTCVRVSAAWEQIIASAGRADETLMALGAWYEQSIISDPDPIRLRMRAAAEAEAEDVRALLRTGYADVQRLIAGVIRRGQDEGVFAAAVDPEAAAWLWIGIGQVLDLNVMMGSQPCDPDGPAGIGQELLRLLGVSQA
ncbi:MAG TPA: TetR/AcrR family transcriptional regulator [Dehalococcoidia bacterium]